MARTVDLVGLSVMLSALANYARRIAAIHKAGRLTAEQTARAFVVVETRLRRFAGLAAKCGLRGLDPHLTAPQAIREAVRLVEALAKPSVSAATSAADAVEVQPPGPPTEAPAQPEAASERLHKASNYTLIGGCSQSFLLTLALVGRDGWSCFHTKHGDWAISLDDEADLPRAGLLPEGVQVLEYGEMTFDLDAMLGVCPGLKEALSAADEGSADHD